MAERLIIYRLRAKEPAALEEIMDRYIPYISTVVWNIVRGILSQEDAEEIVSDVFLAAWNQAKDIRPGQMKPWLAAVARNKAKNKIRGAGFTLPLEEDILEIADEKSPDEALLHQQEAELVRKAVDTLGEPDREIFLRHYYYAQTVAEIGAALDMNESTVKTKLRRGRMRLKDTLERWDAV